MEQRAARAVSLTASFALAGRGSAAAPDDASGGEGAIQSGSGSDAMMFNGGQLRERVDALLSQQILSGSIAIDDALAQLAESDEG